MNFISKILKSKKDDEKMKTVESCDFKLMKDAETDFKTGFYAPLLYLAVSDDFGGEIEFTDWCRPIVTCGKYRKTLLMPIQLDAIEPEPEPEVEEPAASYPTDDPSAWSTAITPDFDFEGIVVLQQRLVEWKWLAKDGYYEGVLDEATVQAIVDFQTVCAENGIDLIPCDPMDPVIETDTLALLFNANGEVYANPYA